MKTEQEIIAKMKAHNEKVLCQEKVPTVYKRFHRVILDTKEYIKDEHNEYQLINPKGGKSELRTKDN